MPISSNTRKAGPFTGTGLVTTYPFNFKVFQAADVYVVRADMTGTESVLVLNTDYTVSLNADQDVSPGGNVVLSSALTSGYTLVITSSIENLQPTDLTNGGGFYPSVITDALDRACIQIQQLQEVSDRSLKIDITSSTTPANYLTEVKAARDAAQSAQSAAEIAQAAAEAALDSFDDRYLGAKAADPTLDNDGNALVEGAIYWNTTLKNFKVWSGAAWQVWQYSVSDGDKGDITVSGGGATWTLDSSVVSSFARTLLDDADAAAARATLEVASYSAATEATAGVVELATATEAAAGTDAVRAITPSTLRGGLNASGSAPVYACRAWVNFNGTGTPSIRSSGNVSSITDRGLGLYTINLTTPLPSANCAVVGCAGSTADSYVWSLTMAGSNLTPTSPSTTAIPMALFAGTTSGDPTHACVAIF